MKFRWKCVWPYRFFHLLRVVINNFFFRYAFILKSKRWIAKQYLLNQIVSFASVKAQEMQTNTRISFSIGRFFFLSFVRSSVCVSFSVFLVRLFSISNFVCKFLLFCFLSLLMRLCCAYFFLFMFDVIVVNLAFVGFVLLFVWIMESSRLTMETASPFIIERNTLSENSIFYTQRLWCVFTIRNAREMPSPILKSLWICNINHANIFLSIQSKFVVLHHGFYSLPFLLSLISFYVRVQVI